MNTTRVDNAGTVVRTSAFRQRRNMFARSVISALLKKMNQGRLELVLPDGSVEVYGESPANCCDPDTDIAARLIVKDEEFFWRCLLHADIGLAESFMDGLCDCASVRSLVSWFLVNQHKSPFLNESSNASRLINAFGLTNRIVHRIRRNTHANSRRNIREHYDLGNEFFKLFLDRSMTYSSALFENKSDTLQAAQEAKFKRAANKLRISSSDKVLDLGCGWGGLSVYLAKTYGCSVTSVTISQQQYNYVRQLIAKEKLEHLIDLRLTDYRDLQGKFDKIVSIEMIEAVGDEFMNVFIGKLDELLAFDGLLLMQMITCADSRYELMTENVDFIQKHIFPGSLLPSLRRVSEAMIASGEMFLVDLFDMTPSYVTTLRKWQDAFESNISAVRSSGFDERFVRKWLYYFEYCQAAFDMRNISVVQATYSRPNNRKLGGDRA